VAQVNINDSDPTPIRAGPTPVSTDTTPAYTGDPSGARGAATNNLTWALAMMLIIAAIAVAVVFVIHHV
jgi:hypothetical protein